MPLIGAPLAKPVAKKPLSALYSQATDRPPRPDAVWHPTETIATGGSASKSAERTRGNEWASAPQGDSGTRGANEGENERVISVLYKTTLAGEGGAEGCTWEGRGQSVPGGEARPAAEAPRERDHATAEHPAANVFEIGEEESFFLQAGEAKAFAVDVT